MPCQMHIKVLRHQPLICAIFYLNCYCFLASQLRNRELARKAGERLVKQSVGNGTQLASVYPCNSTPDLPSGVLRRVFIYMMAF